jgi:hypothetical protein
MCGGSKAGCSVLAVLAGAAEIGGIRQSMVQVLVESI